MKKAVSALMLAGLVAFGGPATAEMCTIDAVPAATLLLPYFEVDYTDLDGVTTLMSINNSSATAILAHVTLWTNWSQPSIDFDVYLTGYDVVTINMRDVFNGILPRTASAGQDPSDTISPQGPISQDINFASCNGFLPFTNPVVTGSNLSRVRDGHTGNPVPSLGAGRCLGLAIEDEDGENDEIGRGYVTVDTVNQCSTAFAYDPGYFVDGGAGIATAQNVLWGDYFIVNPGENFAFGDNLVHIEADGLFNAASTPTGYTFYGRYTFPTGGDNREPLGTTWAVRYLNGGAFTGGTDLIVWRDSTANNQPNNGFVCNVGPNWYPLNETEVIAFDEEEDAVEICFASGGGVISPPDPGSDPPCFPLETGRYAFGEGDLAVPYTFGWSYLNLNLPVDAPTGDTDFGSTGLIAQSYVTQSHNASGRFQVGLQAIELTSACEDLNPELNASGEIPTFP
jgi:hypothetical protein